jgi:hypothetical protein
MSIFGDIASWIGSATGITPAVKVATAIWSDVADGRMWRSVGWIILGIVLMLLGVAWWIGPSASRANPAGVIGRQLG